MRFREKVDVVTGSSRNIGKRVAEAFAEEGAAVVINAAESSNDLEEAARQFEQRGQRVLPVLADVSDPDAADRLVNESVSEFGRIDILVISHSIRPVKSFDKLTVEDWQQVVGVNMSSKFYLLRTALPEMVRTGGGGVVVIGGGKPSVGVMARRGRTHVAASLAGGHALLASLQREYTWKRLRINYLSPGITNTFSKHRERYLGSPPAGPQADPELVRTIPLGRIGQPEEIGDAVLWLASDEAASYVVGTTIAVNGGWP